MDTAWIQVFVLSLSECAAPAGKTVCQEQELNYQFFDKAECEEALRQLISYKDGADNIIVHADRSRCLPTVRQTTTYESVREANENLSGLEDWGTVPVEPEARRSPRKPTRRVSSSCPPATTVTASRRARSARSSWKAMAANRCRSGGGTKRTERTHRRRRAERPLEPACRRARLVRTDRSPVLCAGGPG